VDVNLTDLNPKRIESFFSTKGFREMSGKDFKNSLESILTAPILN
jgi:hypothetical protein